MGGCIVYTRIRLLLLIRPFIFSFSNIQTLKPFVTLFSRTVRPRSLKAAAAYFSLYFSIFLCLQFSTLKFFVTLFSRTLRPRRLKIGTHVDSGQIYHVYRNQAAAAYSSLYFSIFLSPQFSTFKFFVTLFSGTMRPRRLKLGTHVDSGRMYHLYRNQAAADYSSLYVFIFLSLQFSNIKIFRQCHSSHELWDLEKLKLGTHMDGGQLYGLYWNQLLLLIRPFISSFFFLSNFKTLTFFVTLFSRTVRPRRLKLGTYVNSGQMYRVYRNQAAAYSSLYFFIFFLSSFQTLKFSSHFFRNCETLKDETWYIRGQWVDVSCIPESGCCYLFVPSFILSPIFKH